MKKAENWFDLFREPRAGREWSLLNFLKESVGHQFLGSQIELAQELDVNYWYLNSIVNKLKKEKLIVVTKGKVRLAAFLLKEGKNEK